MNNCNVNRSFNKNWKARKEGLYNHWISGRPINQIQLAFRNHWQIFRKLIDSKHFNKGRMCLEVGCGRGTMSAYFSNAGFNCTLLDSSQNIIKIAKWNFKKNKLKAKFVIAEAKNLPFENNLFDIVFSIGLLEHFKNIDIPISEQVRVLNKRGIFIGYVVPKYKNNIQNNYSWINEILKEYADIKNYTRKNISPKEQFYRSTTDAKEYKKIMKRHGLINIGSTGIYPLPMISHSPEFPFTLMPDNCERIIVKHFEEILEKRKKGTHTHPWLCQEGYGQAFLVWGSKR